jgi:hypothetical protein
METTKQKLDKKRLFILQYIKKHLIVSSWDWDADVAYASEFYPELKEFGIELLNSASVDPIRIAAHRAYLGKVKNDRLRITQGLVNDGLVDKNWSGTGFGGRSMFGVSRTKSYQLTGKGKMFLTEALKNLETST